jgi:hypothetical protein
MNHEPARRARAAGLRRNLAPFAVTAAKRGFTRE